MLSLEEEFKRMDGVPYIIDFYQDFSTDDFESLDIIERVPDIIIEIKDLNKIIVRPANDSLWLRNKQRSAGFEKCVEKM